MAPILSVSRAQSLPVGAHHHNPRQRQQQRLSPYGSTRKHAHAKACPPTRPVRTVDPVMDGHDDDSMTLGSMPSLATYNTYGSRSTIGSNKSYGSLTSKVSSENSKASIYSDSFVPYGGMLPGVARDELIPSSIARTTPGSGESRWTASSPGSNASGGSNRARMMGQRAMSQRTLNSHGSGNSSKSYPPASIKRRDIPLTISRQSSSRWSTTSHVPNRGKLEKTKSNDFPPTCVVRRR